MQCSGIQTLHNLFIIYSATNMWHRSFKASFPQKHHLQQQRRLEPCLSSSSQLFWPCPACGCWCHQPHVQLDGGACQGCQVLGKKSLTSVLSNFILFRGTNSILRTFLGETFRKKHPVLQICFVGNLKIGSFDNTFEQWNDVRLIHLERHFCKKKIMKNS